jgi:hypothetical protein
MATITITPGNSFTATETVTSTKLNNLGSPTAALTAASIGTADIADDAITPALIADDAVTTPAILDANVTFAKLTDVIDDDTMATATSTNLATSESIKAYVDSAPNFTPSAYAGEQSVTLPNGLIMKFGYKATIATNDSISFSVAFPTVCVNVSATTAEANSNARWPMKVSSLAVGGFNIKHGNSTVTNHGAFWQAIGY